MVDNITLDPNVYDMPGKNVITVQDIISAEQAQYMNLIFISASIILIYAIWVNFCINSKYHKWLESHRIDIHELILLPALMLFGIAAEYKGMI